MRSTARAAVAAVALVAAAAGGCGGGGDAAPGTTAGREPVAAYQASANAACRGFAAEKAALRALEPRGEADVLDWLRRSTDMLRGQAAAVRAIPVPDAVAPDVRRGLAGLDAAARLFDGAHERISDGARWRDVVVDLVPRLQAQGGPAGRALIAAGLVECAT